MQANPQILQVRFCHMFEDDLSLYSECFYFIPLFPVLLLIHFMLQPMLQELGKQNPHLMRLIQEHQTDFLRLINEPVDNEE